MIRPIGERFLYRQSHEHRGVVRHIYEPLVFLKPHEQRSPEVRGSTIRYLAFAPSISISCGYLSARLHMALVCRGPA